MQAEIAISLLAALPRPPPDSAVDPACEQKLGREPSDESRPYPRQPVNFIRQMDVIHRVQRLQVDDAHVVAFTVVHLRPDVLSRRCRGRNLEAEKKEEKKPAGQCWVACPPRIDALL